DDAHVASLGAVGLPQIGRDRINNDERNITNLDDLLFKQRHVGLQVEGATVLAVGAANCRNDLNTLKIGSGSHQAGDNGIGGAILRRQDNDITYDRRATLTTRPLAPP